MKDSTVQILLWIVVVLIVAVVFGIRFWIAGGDLGCTFSADPALCATVKGLNP
jgi:uncharacterized protein YneF (UPF0154 family)